MQTKTNEGNHFLQVLNQEIVEREHELEDCQRKLTILKDLRENYISASRRKDDQHRYRLTSDWRTATEATIAFLRGQSGPVPTVRILEHLKEVGIALGGSQPRNSLSVMLSRSRLFKAHGRRGWTLAEDDGGDRGHGADGNSRLPPGQALLPRSTPAAFSHRRRLSRSC